MSILTKIFGEKKIKVRILAKEYIGGMKVHDGFIKSECFGGFVISNGASEYYGELTPEGEGIFPNGPSEILGWVKWEFADKQGVLEAMDDEGFRRFRMALDHDEKAVKAFAGAKR